MPLDPTKAVAAVILRFTAWPSAAELGSDESKIIEVFAIAVGNRASLTAARASARR